MTTIREYTSQDQTKFKEFYQKAESIKVKTNVLNALKKSENAKRTLQAGCVGIIGLHFTQLMKAQDIFKSLSCIVVEIVLWSTSVGLLWYSWLYKKYQNKLKKTTEHIVFELANIQKEPKSNVWVMVNETNDIIGTVALRFEHGEGKLCYLTGTDIQNRLLLVQNAFKFGRTNKIQVISKWDQDSKWSESSL